MSNFNETNNSEQPAIDVFSDPVAYLAAHGVDATLIAETSLSAAA